MTLSELYNSVAQLGFETSLEYDDGFIYALNRAILQVNALRPARNSFTVNHKPPENVLQDFSFSPIAKKEDICFTASGVKSYYFEADGVGCAYIECFDEERGDFSLIGEIRLDSAGGFIPYRGFIKRDGEFFDGTVRLRFTGEYLYFVRYAAMYRYLYSEREEDIPSFEPYTRYDISTLVPDFLSMCSPPIKEDSDISLRIGSDYDTEDGRILLLPYGKSGVYRIIYNRRPAPLKITDALSEDMTEIDLDEELCSLLPPLVASFVWLEDEPEKAQYYFAVYESRARDFEARVYPASPTVFKNLNGW